MTPLQKALERIEECERTRAKKLDLSGLGLTELPIETCELEWLEELDLSSQVSLGGNLRNLITELPSRVAQFTNLVTLNIDHCLFIDLSFLVYLPVLQNLDCRRNQLSSLFGLMHVPQLHRLDCGNNFLSSLSDLAYVPQLQSLDCGDNLLLSLPGLVHVPQLQSLDCRDNLLPSLPDLVHVPQLQSLDCGDNQLSSLSDLVHVPQLQSLNCRNNQLSNLSGLVYVSQLQILDFSSNQLSSLSDLAYVRQLQSLDCGGNELSTLSGLVHVQQLESLSCWGNVLSSLLDLAHVPNLQTLNCSSNNLTSLSSLVYVSQLHSLDCGNNQLMDLSGLVYVPQLQSLRCWSNQLSTLSHLAYVPELQSLDCGGNKLSTLSGLVHVPLLESLSCWRNQLSSLSDLVHTTKLQSLDCGANRLSSLSDLAYVPLLKSLRCMESQLSNLSDLVYVPQLQSLDCHKNQLSSLSGLVHVPQLESLSCWRNQLSNLSDLAYVPRLQSLDCGGNQLSSLSDLVHVPHLLNLRCWDNQLSSLSDLAHLPQLQRLNCACNFISNIDCLYDEVVNYFYSEINLFNNPIKGLPPAIFGDSILSDCKDSLRNYLIDLSKGHQKQRQIKLQIIGNGRVGKTTLAYALEHKQAPPEAFKSTHGIVIKDLQQVVEGQAEPVTLQLWDFGGQEIYHATHRLFLSNDCVYLLLWAEETVEHEGEKRHPVSYWLESLHDLGSDSPVILVKNQIDRSDKLPARPDGLIQEMPGVQQIEHETKVSAMKYQRMAGLRGAIESVLEKLAYRVCLNLPNSWVSVQDAIKELEGQRTLPFAQFKQLCIKAGVSDAEWFVDYLHKSGMLFYKKGAFQDQIILDQNWVIEAVYTLFDPNKPFRSSIEGMLGKFSGLLSTMFWPEVEKTEHEIYLSFMRNCGICYEPGCKDQRGHSEKPLAERQFVLPALLPEQNDVKTAWGAFQESDWQFRVKFPFLHRSIIERLIIALGIRWSGEPWRNGIYCADTTFGQVLMEACYTDSESSNAGHISFQLRQHRRDESVYMLRELVRENSPHNRFQEYLKCGEEPEQELPEFKKRDDKGTALVVKEKTVNLFISYSHDDEVGYKDELEKCLKAIKRKHPLEYWDDRQMFAGDLVNEEILERLEAADIVVLLISRNFFASDYCFNIEMEAALKRYEEKKNVVIPVIIRHTDDWHDFEIGKITALPKDGKPLSDWPDPDEFWADVQKGIRRQVEKLLGED